LLQLANGIAVTIQFHPGNNGCNQGILEYPATLAGQPKHAATQNHHVKVGVANKRKKLEGLSIHKYQPAHVFEHHSLNGLGGQTAGQHIGQYWNQVKAENIGIHSSIFKPSPIGTQNRVGSHPGAKGAQLSGVAIQPHHQNPQLNHCIKLSTPANTWSIFSSISSKLDKKSLLESEESSLSGIPSLSESILIFHNAVSAYFC
jgi:hypothetical protein